MVEFGDLRMLCQEEPGQAAWRAIVATVDAKHALDGAHADEVEAIWLPYACEALERWPHALRAITPNQLQRVADGQRVASLQLVRHLRWSGIWGKHDMAKLAAQADLVALPSLHLYQTEEADAATLRRARPDLMAGVEVLRVESCFLKPGEIAPLMAAIAPGGALRALHVDGHHAEAWLRACATHAARLTRLTSLRMRDGKLNSEDTMALIDAWASAGCAARLTELDLHCIELVPDAEHALIHACTALTSLGLRAQDLVGHDLVRAFEGAPLPQIERLNAGLFGLSDAAIPALGALIRAMPALRRLSLQQSAWSTERGNVPKLDALGPLPATLTEVDAYGLSPERRYVPGARPVTLRLGGVMADKVPLDALLDALDLSGVVALKPINSTLGPQGIQAFTRRALPALREADLWGCALDDEGVQHVLDAPWSAQLSTLALHANRVSDACVPALTAWLERGAAIRQLPLESCYDTLQPQALAPLMEAACRRSAPLMLSAHGKTGPNAIALICPTRDADGSPWPPHVQFGAVERI